MLWTELVSDAILPHENSAAHSSNSNRNAFSVHALCTVTLLLLGYGA